jgi:hypothetical protein
MLVCITKLFRAFLSGPTLILSIILFAPFSPVQLAAQEPAPDQKAAQGASQERREAGPLRRIPRQKALTTAAIEGIVREAGNEGGVRPVPAVVTLRNLGSGQVQRVQANAEGVFRAFPLAPGRYEVRAEADGYSAFALPEIAVAANEVLMLEISLVRMTEAEIRSRLPRLPDLGPAPPAAPAEAAGTYRELRHRLDADPNYVENPAPESLPPVADIYNVMPDRWYVPFPEYRRYPQKGEYIYTKSHWYDPFNRNRLKGDYPIWPSLLGKQTFLIVTATAETFFDERRVPLPSNVSAARPGSSEFFGKGEQAFFDQTLRFSFDLFHGDTSFKPVDWRIRITPEISLNDIIVRELGVVGPDVRSGTNRFDTHVGLQEAFVEVKLRDLSPNYDFVSVRAGIQQFRSDFRGFLFAEEQPGVRVFGNLHSDRIEYNAAYFDFLEKNTNSGLNRFRGRKQQVLLGNVYLQDFFFPGYTAEFLGAWNKDDGRVHFDDNGFLVRPAPIGLVVRQGPNGGPLPHSVNVGYVGWLGNGHIGRFNLTHAFFQAGGKDTLNPIAGRAVTVNAQMAAAEISLDRDWLRYRVSVFYASGDAKPRDSRARGFDAIVDFPAFAGGLFSFWNREGIRLTGSAVALTTPGSLLPNLRSNKEEGQANFVNPGIFLVNAGTDLDITPKLRGFVNVNCLRFMRTEPLELLLFQAPIRHSIGVDYGAGVQYRPPLSENILLTGGAAALTPGQGLRDIYGGRTLFTVFGSARFTF